ncbi:MAG: hypothetical protein JSW23_03585, partial [Planctomycetota bacterium]
LRMMPNMVLTAPANEVEVKLALEFAAGAKKPVIIRYPKDLVPAPKFVRSACGRPFTLGKSVVVKKGKGASVAIVAYGSVLSEAIGAAGILGREGMAVEVINARFAAPIDESIVAKLLEGKGLVTVEDHRLSCGFGSAVLEEAARMGQIRGRIAMLGMDKSFVGHDLRRVQLESAGVSAKGIVRAVKGMVGA